MAAVATMAGAGSAPGARIGPNAIIRSAEALIEAGGEALRDRVFAAAGLRHYLTALPTDMVDEEEVARLNAALIGTLGAKGGLAVARRAGELTGDYLLANRIPKAAQAILPLLPRRLAARVLLGAIGRHAWTFAGSGHFGYRFGQTVELSIKDSPLARHVRIAEPACAFYTGTFERIFRAILDPAIRVEEIECEAMGAPACRFVARGL